MAENIVKEHEVVVKNLSNTQLTKEMVDWLLAHGKNLNDSIKYHDPLLIQCVKEVKPSGFAVVTIKGNKYKIIDFPNDSILFTPDDLVQLETMWTIIDEAEVDVPSVEEQPVEPAPEKPTPKKTTKRSVTNKAEGATTEKKTPGRKKKTE